MHGIWTQKNNHMHVLDVLITIMVYDLLLPYYELTFLYHCSFTFMHVVECMELPLFHLSSKLLQVILIAPYP